ncbi:MAG TPA: hypothetical protein VII22_26880 [Streptosporangiaceae bacterium]
MTVPDLTEPERSLWAAFPRGAWADLRTGDPAADDLEFAGRWGPSRIIRAEVIAALLLGACAAEPGHSPAVRLRGARISGRLDLMGATVSCPLVCEYCHFDGEPRFVETSAKTVRIVASRLPGFNGTRMRLEGILNLSSSVVGSVIRLDQAKVTGQVCLREVTAGAGTGEIAVAADGLAVDGNADCAGLIARGTIRLQGAQVSGTIDLTGAQITGPQERAITLSNASIGGRLIAEGMSAEGEFWMHNTSVGASIGLSGARLSAPSGVALSAGGLTVEGGVFCLDGFTTNGEIRLIGARLGANLALAGAVLSNPGKMALNLDRATVGDCDATGIVCSGQVSCVGTRIASGLDLTGARLDGGNTGLALAADGATVEGMLVLTQLHARGEVSFRTAHVGQRVLLTDAHVENPGGMALRFSRAEIAADLFCRRMAVIGMVRLYGARIGGAFELIQVHLVNPADVALDARYVEAGQLALIPDEPIQGTVDLSHARIGLLTDDPACWPATLDLSGLTYQALEPQLPARDRLRWLTRHTQGHEPQPYEQLASYYSTTGQPAQARRVLYTRERLRRDAKAPLGRAWSLLQDLTVGYGYQPWRAALWLIVLLAAGSILFAAAPPAPLLHGGTPHFNAVIYTLDLLLPVVDLGQKHAFNPGGAEQWFSYVLIAAGWLLATTIAAGVARVLSRN